MKGKLAIFNLVQKADIWWQDLKRAKSINDKKVSWNWFKKEFKMEYLSEYYYEGKAKEFYELRLGSMSMHDLCTKFLSLLRYVPYLNEEKPKIQRFLSSLPNFYKDKLEFDEPKTLYEAMRKDKLTCDQSKSKNENPFNFKRRDGNGFKRREFKLFNKHKSFWKIPLRANNQQ